MGIGTAMWEIYQDYSYHEDKTLAATVDPSELQGSPGSSLLWSIAWVKVL